MNVGEQVACDVDTGQPLSRDEILDRELMAKLARGERALVLLCEVNRDGWVSSGMTLDVNIGDLLAETDHAKCTRDHCEITGHG